MHYIIIQIILEYKIVPKYCTFYRSCLDIDVTFSIIFKTKYESFFFAIFVSYFDLSLFSDRPLAESSLPLIRIVCQFICQYRSRNIHPCRQLHWLFMGELAYLNICFTIHSTQNFNTTHFYSFLKVSIFTLSISMAFTKYDNHVSATKLTFS